MNIIFTDAAYAYIKQLLAKNNALGFRLSIKKTGCSGYAYSPTLIEKPEQKNMNDIQFQKNDILIFIDSAWMHLLENLKIDYIEEEKSGLKQKRLVFTNPNETSRCGCGESFHAE